ncbi:MAG: hypothetical protein Q8830_02785 [Candidatus Phytoplasma australasiaticum]|nr:hypothetical protein [Candidatus Phytoplasma australasiaticum]
MKPSMESILKKLERYHREYVNNGYHPKPVKRIFIRNHHEILIKRGFGLGSMDETNP